MKLALDAWGVLQNIRNTVIISNKLTTLAQLKLLPDGSGTILPTYKWTCRFSWDLDKECNDSEEN